MTAHMAGLRTDFPVPRVLTTAVSAQEGYTAVISSKLITRPACMLVLTSLVPMLRSCLHNGNTRSDLARALSVSDGISKHLAFLAD